MSVVIAPTQAFNDTSVTARTFGIGDASRLVWNLAGQDSNRAMLMPVLYKQDWSGISQYYSTARTNEVRRSSQMNSWTKGSITVDSNTAATLAPDGTQTADKLMEMNASARHENASNASSIPISTLATMSVYGKAEERHFLYITAAGSGALSACFDLTAGTVSSLGASATATITPVGNGWYRCTVTITTAGANSAMWTCLRTTSAATVQTYQGDASGTYGLYVWGAQFELGGSATNLIDTPADASVTVTDYSVAATGVVTFATAPASGVPLMYKEPHLPSSNVYRHFGVGDGSSVNYSLPFAPATPLIYKRDWAGNSLLYATSRTNLCLQSAVFKTTWSPTTITIADNSIAAPDGTTTADTLTATGANSTLIQDLGVIGSAVKTFSIWIKRKTGTGNIDLTLNGGTGWTTQTVTTDWARYEITATLANPDVGIRIVADTDAIYVWGAQCEAASASTSYIPTTTVAVSATDYTLDAAGRGDVTFAAAPAAAAILSWTGTMGATR